MSWKEITTRKDYDPLRKDYDEEGLQPGRITTKNGTTNEDYDEDRLDWREREG